LDTSFEEKSAWVTLLALVAVFGCYFLMAARMLSAGVTETATPFVPLFIVITVLLVIVLAVGHAAAAIVSGGDKRDERDQQIERRAESNSGWILAVGVISAVFALALPIGKAWIANGLLMSLVVSEVVNYVLRLYYYRRGV
jgi:fatty acid desaturase